MTAVVETGSFIDESAIDDALHAAATKDAGRVREILAKARELGGLEMDEVAVLSSVSDPSCSASCSPPPATSRTPSTARGWCCSRRSTSRNLCTNDCLYCAFRVRNKELKRRALTQAEIRHEVELLVDQGHKRILLVAGESYPKQGFGYVLDSIATIYEVKRGNGEIRRVNVNVAPLSVDEFKSLKATGIGTYQLFQETYHRDTYKAVHLGGKKMDYDWRVTAMHRAMEAGIDDVGIGVLFGLFDWRFEILALMQHVRELERAYGVGPHTISMPRLEPASGSDMACEPPQPVSDVDFRKIVAILRLAVPYTGMIMSTRETANLRRETFALGVCQISAGSRTNPGGYAEDEKFDTAQFQLGDHRSLDEVIRDVASLGYMPSFCTACYRLGRTGMDFMDLAKPGDIKHHCDPNALSTFLEYLLDYGSDETRAAGEELIERKVAEMDDVRREHTVKMLGRVRGGARDVLC